MAEVPWVGEYVILIFDWAFSEGYRDGAALESLGRGDIGCISNGIMKT